MVLTSTSPKELRPQSGLHFIPGGPAHMTLYICDVCTLYEYDSTLGDADFGIPAGTEPSDFPNSWVCPICGADRTHLIPRRAENAAIPSVDFQL